MLKWLNLTSTNFNNPLIMLPNIRVNYYLSYFSPLHFCGTLARILCNFENYWANNYHIARCHRDITCWFPVRLGYHLHAFCPAPAAY